MHNFILCGVQNLLRTFWKGSKGGLPSTYIHSYTSDYQDMLPLMMLYELYELIDVKMQTHSFNIYLEFVLASYVHEC